MKPARSRRPSRVATPCWDALAPLGVKTIQMPMTAERVWRRMKQHSRTGAEPCTSRLQYYRAGSVAGKRAICFRSIRARSFWRVPQPDPLLKFRLAAPPRAHRHWPDRRLKGVSVKGGTVRIGAADDPRRIGGVGELRATAQPLPRRPDTSGTRGHKNRGRSAAMSRTPTRHPTCRRSWPRSTPASSSAEDPGRRP